MVYDWKKLLPRINPFPWIVDFWEKIQPAFACKQEPPNPETQPRCTCRQRHINAANFSDYNIHRIMIP